MKTGDLVRWRGPSKSDNSQIGSAGIVVEIGDRNSFELAASVLWEDGVVYLGVNARWLEVLSETR